jgi:hypothetical protein
MFMHRSRRVPRWLVAGAFSVGLALVLSFAVPMFFASQGVSVAVAQPSDDSEDDDSNSNDNAAPTTPQAPAPSASPMPMASPSTGSGTGTGTGTGAGTGTSMPASSGTQQGAGSQRSTMLESDDPGRGGIEMPGQPACYKPAANVTERRMYNESRPACAGEHQ